MLIQNFTEIVSEQCSSTIGHWFGLTGSQHMEATEKKTFLANIPAK